MEQFKVADYYDDIYDVLEKDYGMEAALVGDLLQSHALPVKTVLDVGCGTGRHAKILKDRFGFDMTGVDIDADMIAVAKASDASIPYHVGDMRSFDTGVQYDAVICMFNTINNATSADDMVATLRNFSRHLKPGGMLIVEPWLTPETFEVGRVFTDIAKRGDVHVCRMTTSAISGNISTLYSKWLVGQEGAFQTGDEVIHLSVFSVPEMLDFFRVSGFSAKYDPMAGCFGTRGLYIAAKQI
jgi:ubiquinone/menaquinone biosynthesis C-methylase UbiE